MPQTRWLAGLGLILLMTGMFTANVSAARRNPSSNGKAVTPLRLGLPGERRVVREGSLALARPRRERLARRAFGLGQDDAALDPGLHPDGLSRTRRRGGR